MLSSRQASKELKTLVLPEVRGEVIRTQKLLTKVLCDSRAGGQTTLSTEAEAALLKVINTLFPESFPFAIELIHTTLDEMQRRGFVYGTHATARAANALAARLINGRERGESVALSLVEPLLRHTADCLRTHPNLELHALCNMNRAVVKEKSDSSSRTSISHTMHQSAPLWIDAVRHIPQRSWVKYPSLLNGTT